MVPLKSMLAATAAVTAASPAAGFCCSPPTAAATITANLNQSPDLSAQRFPIDWLRDTQRLALHRASRSHETISSRTSSKLSMGGGASSSEQTDSAAGTGRSSSRHQQQVGVSRAFNRALGSILSTGDMFGGVGGGGGVGLGRGSFRQRQQNRENQTGRRWSDSGSEANGMSAQDGQYEDGDDEDEDEDDADDDDTIRQSLKELSSGSPLDRDERPMWRRIGQKRSRKSNVNRLLRAKTDASAAIVVDGPFPSLVSYMTLPVSEYSLLDSSIIRRVSETAFRFQIPLRDLVGLDFTPTMEVEVELDPKSNAVVFRSTRSTLYGNVAPTGQLEGEEGGTDPWPAATADNKTEYFRVSFDARLRWAKGDASTEPRRRGSPNGFTGEIARRPRPTPRASSSSGADTGAHEGLAKGSKATTTESATNVVDNDDVVKAAAKEVELRAERGTIFCDTGVRVQILLPPPYNTVLPWRLVRALLAKVLSTIVGYVLPRFLELLANDFYSWQSGSRRPEGTTTESGRTLLGTGSSKSSQTPSGGDFNDPDDEDHSDGPTISFPGRWGMGGNVEGSRAPGDREMSTQDATGRGDNVVASRLRGVDLSVQRLRNIRGPRGWGSSSGAGAGERGNEGRAASDSLYYWGETGQGDGSIVENGRDAIRYADDMQECLEAVDRDDAENEEEGVEGDGESADGGDNRPRWRRGPKGIGRGRWGGGGLGKGPMSWWG